MAEKRITYFDWTDYSIASLDLIIEGLEEEFIASAVDTIKRLNELREEVVCNFTRLDDADSILNYIDGWITLFQAFSYDLERILKEMPAGVENRHIDIIKQIYERSTFEEKESYRAFKDEHIEKDLKDESLRPLLDEICAVSGSHMLICKQLGFLSKRLATFIGGAVSIPEKGAKSATLILPLIQQACSWADISIQLINDWEAEINISGKPQGVKNFIALGFKDKRDKTGKSPNKIWKNVRRQTVSDTRADFLSYSFSFSS